VAPGIAVATVVLSVPLTFLLVALDIHRSAAGEARYRACAVASLPFFTFFAVGNAVAALLVPLMAPEWATKTLFEPLPDLFRALAYAFIGVVAFEVIISHLTYNILGQTYTLGDRINSFRGPAQEAAINREIEIVDRIQQKMARQLCALIPDKDLNSYIIQHLGTGEANRLTEQATAENANPLILKSTALAGRNLSEAKAIVRDAKKQKGWWTRLRGRLMGEAS